MPKTVSGSLLPVNMRHSRQKPAREPYSYINSTFIWRMPGHGWAPSTSDKNASDAIVAVQDRALAAFLVVEDKLDRDTGTSRPAGIGRIAAIADQVARIAGRALGHSDTHFARIN